MEHSKSPTFAQILRLMHSDKRVYACIETICPHCLVADIVFNSYSKAFRNNPSVRFLAEPEGCRQWPYSAPLWFPAGVWLWGRWLWCWKPVLSELVQQRRPGLWPPRGLGASLQKALWHVRGRRRWWHDVNGPESRMDSERTREWMDCAWIWVSCKHGLFMRNIQTVNSTFLLPVTDTVRKPKEACFVLFCSNAPFWKSYT